ncbi:MAG: protein kinase, partial [bacterium]|nr:protein kinase [bacterium]
GGRMTETGLSLGTPHYMSPEQATAEKDLTNRSDIYSLGAVLYEMLTGDPPHTGSSAQAIIMKIVTDEARPVTESRKSVPPHVAAATAKALEKLAADRFASAARFAEALGNLAFVDHATLQTAATPARGRTTLVSWAGWAVAVVVVLGGWLLWPTVTPPERTVTTIPAPPGHDFVGGASIALSPDGTRIAFAAIANDGNQQLWVRDLDTLYAVPLPNTDDAAWPFWS